METKIGQSVIFVSKDNTYSIAINFVLALTFKTEVTRESSITGNLGKQFQLLQPDFIMVDLDSYNSSEIEALQNFKTLNPTAKLIALFYEDKPVLFPDKIFNKIIYKNNFFPGYTSVLNYPFGEETKKEFVDLIHTEKKEKKGTNFFQWYYSFATKRIFSKYNLANIL